MKRGSGKERWGKIGWTIVEKARGTMGERKRGGGVNVHSIQRSSGVSQSTYSPSGSTPSQIAPHNMAMLVVSCRAK